MAEISLQIGTRSGGVPMSVFASFPWSYARRPTTRRTPARLHVVFTSTLFRKLTF